MVDIDDVSKYRRTRKFPMLNIIEHVFRNEEEIRRLVWEMRNDNPYKGEKIGGGPNGKISSPTEMQAIKAMTPIRKVTLADGYWINRPEEWLKVVDCTYKFFMDADLPIFKAAVTGVNYKKACRDLGITHTTFYTILREGQNYAIAVACQLGLIKIV